VLVARSVGLESEEDYRRVFETFMAQWNDYGISKLAEYVIHRKITLNLLNDRLQRQEDGKFDLEESIHRIIFPLKATSDDVRPEKMNLWIIDERLSYHSYLASDIPLDKVEPISVESRDRPDLLIFNRPIAFSESGFPYQSIVLIEFKRPERDDYRDKKNPIEQIYRYVDKVKSGTVTDRRGRTINVPPGTPFYAYIICDLTPSIVGMAKFADLKPTPDSNGYFGYSSTFGVYIEIISFNKLLSDAGKRNAVLFEKLNLGN
jgi:hypothetical protein